MSETQWNFFVYRYYNNFNEGEFILYKHDSLSTEVRNNDNDLKLCSDAQVACLHCFQNIGQIRSDFSSVHCITLGTFL